MSTGTNACDVRVNQDCARPNDSARVITYTIPAVNIVETAEAYRLDAELPGVSKEGLEISLEGNELTLVGRRTGPVPNAQLVYRESNPRDFRRVFELDPAIDTTRIAARLDNGILHLDLPKADKVKPRKIQLD